MKCLALRPSALIPFYMCLELLPSRCRTNEVLLGRIHGQGSWRRCRPSCATIQGEGMEWGQALSALWEWSILLSSVHKVGKLVHRRTLWPKKGKVNEGHGVLPPLNCPGRHVPFGCGVTVPMCFQSHPCLGSTCLRAKLDLLQSRTF